MGVADLREQPQAEFEVKDGGVDLAARPSQLVTVGFEL